MLLVVLASTTRVTETGGLTVIAFIVIAIFAALVIAGILYGARQKRVRAAAEEEEKQRTAELTAQDEAPATPVPAPAEPSPPPEAAPPPAEPAARIAEAPAKPVAKAEPAPEPKPKAAAKPKVAPKTPPEVPPEPRTEPSPAAAPPPPAPDPPPQTAPGSAAVAAAGYALTDVKGLGPKAAALLSDLGISDVAKLAALDSTRAGEVDGQLGTFAGRLTRDRWVEQAKLLAAGDITTFEATYGKL